MGVMVFVAPGPEVTSTIPGFPVTWARRAGAAVGGMPPQILATGS